MTTAEEVASWTGTYPQSALEPAGFGAQQLADLFWVMIWGAAGIWLLVIGVAVYASRISPGPHGLKRAHLLIVGGGIVFPVVVLAALLTRGLAMMPDLRALPDPGASPAAGLRIEVIGEQWWWRVRYWPAGADEPIESANEVRLPVGQRTELTLAANEVIHAFWVPSLGGKMDMIPGRVNRLVVEPTATGVFRGQCAEFCGTSHALMAFAAVVMEDDAFAQWLEAEAAPASEPTVETNGGLDAFLSYGCGGCHAIRGTPASGRIGPDLTHIGARKTLAAGILPNTSDAVARWIAEAEEIKPGSRMPSFGMAPQQDIALIARYLKELK